MPVFLDVYYFLCSVVTKTIDIIYHFPLKEEFESLKNIYRFEEPLSRSKKVIKSTLIRIHS